MATATQFPKGPSGASFENWDDYRFFLSVVEQGTFSAAARILGVSQPTVSRRIAHLEERLGLRLFDHLPEGPALTTEGSALISVARSLRQYAIQLKRIASGLQTSLAGTVVLTTTQGLAESWLPNRIRTFQEVYPDIEVSILASHKRVDLLRHEADVALRFGDPISGDLMGRRLGAARCAIFGSEAYLSAHGRPAGLRDLAHHRLIGSLGDIAALPQNAELAQLAGPSATRLATNDLNVQLAMAEEGLGLVVAPDFMAARYGSLKPVLTAKFEHRIDMWLLTHRDLYGAPRVRALMDFLIQEYQRDRALFEGQDEGDR